MGKRLGVAIVLIASVVGLGVAAPASATPTAYVPIWRNTTHGYAIGQAGMEHADLDGDGVDELIFASNSSTTPGNDQWSVQRFVGGKDRYRLLYQSDPDPAGISAIAILPASGATPIRIAIATWAGRVRVYRGSDRALLLDSQVSSTGGVFQMALADADNDGTVDLVALNDTHTYLLNPVSLAARRTINFGATRMAVGNVDANANSEIVYANGRVVRQVAAASTVVWDRSALGFGQQLAVADIDADGMDEIIATSAGHYIVWDADVQTQKYSKTGPGIVHALRMLDVTGDGVAEIVFTADYNVWAVRPSDGKYLSTFPATGSWMVTNFAIYDADGDGAPEIVLGAREFGQFLLVFDLATGTEEFRSVDTEGPYAGVDVGDVDGDGQKEVVFTSFQSDESYGPGAVMVQSATSFAPLWRISPSVFVGVHELHAVKLADLDGDGAQEILVATDKYGRGELYVFDGKTHRARSRWLYDKGSPLVSLGVADVDGDGILDIVAGGSVSVSNAPGALVYVIDKDTGAVKWRSGNLATSNTSQITEVKVANVDSDPAMEIIAVADTVSVYDGVTHQSWHTTGATYRSFTTLPVTGGPAQLYAGTKAGQLLSINGASHVEQPLGTACAGDLLALGGATTQRLLFTCDGRLGQFNLSTKKTAWATAQGPYFLGYLDSLVTWKSKGVERVAVGGDTQLTIYAPPA